MNGARAPAALAVAVLAASPAWADGPGAGAPAQDYVLHCQGCHGAEGEGVPHKVPTLRATLPLMVTTDAGRDFVTRVPGAASSRLTDASLAAVFNWLVVRFGGPQALRREFTAEEIASGRQRPLAGVRLARDAVAAQLAAAGSPLPGDY